MNFSPYEGDGMKGALFSYHSPALKIDFSLSSILTHLLALCRGNKWVFYFKIAGELVFSKEEPNHFVRHRYRFSPSLIFAG